MMSVPPPAVRLTRPAQIPTVNDLVDATPESVLGSLVGTLHRHSCQFREYYKEHDALDEEYTQQLASLYDLQQQQQPYADKKAASEENRQKAQALREKVGVVDARICIQAMLAFRTMTQAPGRLAWDCLEHALQQLKDDAEIPPVPWILERLAEIVGEHAPDTDRFFGMVRNDDRHVRLVYRAFRVVDNNQAAAAAVYERVCRLSAEAQKWLLPAFSNTTIKPVGLILASMRTAASDLILLKMHAGLLFKSNDDPVLLLRELVRFAKDVMPQAAVVIDAFTESLGFDPATVLGKLRRGAYDDNLPSHDRGRELLSVLIQEWRETKHLLSAFGDANTLAFVRLMTCLLCKEPTWTLLEQCFHPWWRQQERAEMEMEAYQEPVDVLLDTYHHLLRCIGSKSKDNNYLSFLLRSYHQDWALEPSCSAATLERFGRAIEDLDWHRLPWSEAQMQQVHQTWSQIRADRKKRIIYMSFIWSIFKPWMLHHPQPVLTDKLAYYCTDLAFSFCQNAEAIWPDQGERQDALERLWRMLQRYRRELADDEVEAILQRHGDDSGCCLTWARDMTGFDTATVSVRRRRVFCDYALSRDSVMVQDLYRTLSEHAPAHLKDETDLDELIKILTAIMNKDRKLLVGSITEESKPNMLMGIFGALLARPTTMTPEDVSDMERCLEHTLSSQGKDEWPIYARLLSRSDDARRRLVLQHALDQTKLLTVCIYCRSQQEQHQDPVRRVEELAAILSIAKVDRKAVHLVRTFAQWFCASRDKEQQLVPSIVSMARTAARWAAAAQEKNNDHNDGWRVFVVLLDAFLGSRLEAKGILSPVKRKYRLVMSNKSTQQVLMEGDKVIQDHGRWTIWDLDKAVEIFAVAV